MDNMTPSLADIAAVTRDNDGFGDGWTSLIALFIIAGMFGGGGFGINGNRGAATTGDVERGFYQQTNEQMIRGVGNGIADLGYAMNNQLVGLNTNLLQMQYDLGSKVDSCCCNTQRSIDSVKYENALGFAAVNANIDQKFAALEKQNLEQTIGAQAARIQNLELNAALCGVIRYPNQATYNAGNPWLPYGTQF